MKKLFLSILALLTFTSCSLKDIPNHKTQPAIELDNGLTIKALSIKQESIYNDSRGLEEKAFVIELQYVNNTEDDIIIGYNYLSAQVDDEKLTRSFNYSFYIQQLVLENPKITDEDTIDELLEIEIISANTEKSSLLLYTSPPTYSVLKIDFLDLSEYVLGTLYIDISDVQFNEDEQSND